MLHQEEKAKSSPYNLSNFTKPLVSNKKEGNGRLTFKEAISQPARPEFVEDMRKEIGDN